MSRSVVIDGERTLARPRRSLFERSLETMRKRYEFVVCGYVVMPEHVHLLVSELKKALLRQVARPLTPRNPRAPFIHSFIVDEWETTNLMRANSEPPAAPQVPSR